MMMTIYICLDGSVWEWMIHELLSTTVCFYQGSFKSLYLSLSISTTKIDRSLGSWVEGHVGSRRLMDPKIVVEVKVS